MKEIYSQVRNDYNNGEGFYTIDAWKTGNPDEEGKVVAVIEENSGNVYYIDAIARNSKMVQDAIKERINLIFENKKTEIFSQL